ncbi:DUF4336 domain-containing protein [Prodigiosinella aquatilis]|nr:DUF4336 domain-containing protein [Prodigiosinella sp. LS101]WJV52986.1 DUF4336 domain-containing protein [Prodigiosinella sp. LS101]WJV57342.1 DUF4336 domain-containing protein [Pectobacteriaceae bacterium C111]
MNKIGENIWVFNGETVSFFTLPYSTRMTVVRLSDGSLWVHSPIRLEAHLQKQVDELGIVNYLVAPNQLHHLFLKDWQQHYPDAQVFGTHEVQQKRQDIIFDGIFTPSFNAPWSEDIDQLLFTGSSVMEECVFFHKPSKALIVTDLIENFAPESFSPLKRLLAKEAGILAPDGQMPLDWRLSFMLNKSEARQHMEKILNWHPQTIIMAHGLIIDHDAEPFLRRSFHWLSLDQ